MTDCPDWCTHTHAIGPDGTVEHASAPVTVQTISGEGAAVSIYVLEGTTTGRGPVRVSAAVDDAMTPVQARMLATALRDAANLADAA